MMNMKQYVKLYLLILFIATGFLSCDKMEDGYMKYAAGGEIVYIGKADSVKVFPGRNRIQLSWLLVSDPKISKCKVYWNDRMDSSIVHVVRTKGVDTVKVIIGNLLEQTYNFEIYTFDAAGRSSVKVETSGKSYGTRYANSIFNRTLKTVVFDTNRADIEWYTAASDAIAVEIIYTDRLGLERKLTQVQIPNPNNPRDAPAIPVLVTLADFKKGNSFKYRTLYKPTSFAIDTFYTEFSTVVVP